MGCSHTWWTDIHNTQTQMYVLGAALLSSRPWPSPLPSPGPDMDRSFLESTLSPCLTWPSPTHPLYLTRTSFLKVAYPGPCFQLGHPFTLSTPIQGLSSL